MQFSLSIQIRKQNEFILFYNEYFLLHLQHYSISLAFEHGQGLFKPQLTATSWNSTVLFLYFLFFMIVVYLYVFVLAPYVKQCYEGDPQLIQCFIGALHHLRPYLATGIKEIELPSVEPFRMEELSLSLTTGPNGYKVTLRDIDIYGASNFTVTKMK